MILPYYKCCPKLVPEDSVRPETRTLVILNRRKGFVGSFEIQFLINSNLKRRKIEDRIKYRKNQIKSRGGLKFTETRLNTKGEGLFPSMIDAQKRRIG